MTSAARSGRADRQSPYTALARDIRASGLLERRRRWYVGQIVGISSALCGVVVGAVLLGDSWFQLVAAAVLGLVTTQFGFLGHDAAHRQAFASSAANDWAARLLAGLGAGLSYGWWRSKHHRHHGAPNQEGRDPDITSRVFAFTPAQAAERRARGRLGRHQGWYFVPLLTLEGLNLHVASLRTLLGRAPVPHRGVELTLVLVRLGGYLGLLVVLLPPGKAIAFLAVQQAVFGLGLGASFAPNHKGMPIVPREASVDFLRRQVLMSRNVAGGRLVEAAMGGLNFQVEHHLFPSMPRPNLRLARPIVRDHCDRAGVTYTEVGLLESWGIVIGYLNRVGLRHDEPFSCPLLDQRR